MLGVGLNDAAGRTAYLAAFHTAQAYISEKTGRTVKTHKGVHIEFQKLTRSQLSIDDDLRTFLSRSYDLKAIADYETSVGTEVSQEQARDAFEAAKIFVAYFCQELV